MRQILFLAVAALTVYAAVDAYQSPAYRRAGAPRWLWMTLVIVLPVMGPVLWLVRSRTARPPAPIAPDDDPEFLAFLAERARRQRRQPGTSKAPGAGSSPSSDPAAGDGKDGSSPGASDDGSRGGADD
ncbi:phospholipase D-like protein [Rarobacter incanus]|uniref:Phospholipase D-like protein n=1 Tax=Rarobacter incanus TaxID=153494 RepID=A0A542SQS0_9MICO|nr:phospholipase D-like protein [Rarobacter incanus]